MSQATTTWSRIHFDHLYPNVSLDYFIRDGAVKYDLLVEPGGSLQDVKMLVGGASKVDTRSGELVIETPGGSVTQPMPVAFQEIGNRRRPVTVTYAIDPSNISHGTSGARNTSPVERDVVVRFHVESYDARYPLIVDPLIEYSSFFGSRGDDAAESIALDTSNNIIIGGNTTSNDIADGRGLIHRYTEDADGTDAFVAKFSSDGQTLLFLTYIGGPFRDFVQDVETGPGDNIFVGGGAGQGLPTSSRSFQRQPAGEGDGFVARLDASGRLQECTYIGGPSRDLVSDLAVSEAGDVVAVGFTASHRGIASNNAYQSRYQGGRTDGFVAKLDPDLGGQQYFSYLGGSNLDSATGVALDSFGAAYVTGYTNSPDYPERNAPRDDREYEAGLGSGFSDAFVTKLVPDGSAIVYSSFLGGVRQDIGHAIAVDEAGSAVVVGQTESTDFQTTAYAHQVRHNGLYWTGVPSIPSDVFVVKFSPNGRHRMYSTLVGTKDYDFAYGLALASNGTAFVAGSSNRSLHGSNSADALLFALDPSGSRLDFLTYLGGAGRPGGNDYANDIAYDGNGRLVITGHTSSFSFPVFNAYDGTYSRRRPTREAFFTGVDVNSSHQQRNLVAPSPRDNNSASASKGGLRVSAAELRLFPTPRLIDFGSIQIGNQYFRGIEVENRGGTDLSIEVSLDKVRGPFFIDYRHSKQLKGLAILQPNEQRLIRIGFYIDRNRQAPVPGGRFSTKLRIATSDPSAPEYEYTLVAKTRR